MSHSLRNHPVVIGSLALALAGTACTWSNDDIAFRYALPSRESLAARVPESGVMQDGLVQRKDGLTVGEPSAMYEKTVMAGRSFNSLLFAILDLVDRVKQHPPTRREKNRRIWGPIDDRNNPGREVRMVVTRHDELEPLAYSWQIEARREGERDDGWVTVVDGSYQPSDELRRGVGTVTHDAAAVREAGFAGPDSDPNMNLLEIGYDTASDPVMVGLRLEFAAGTLESQFEERSDGRGSLVFDLRADVVPGPVPAQEKIRFTSRWLPGGAGRTDALALKSGDVGADTDLGEECWDGAFRTVYFHEVHDIDGNGVADGTAGTPSSCGLTE